MRGSEPSQVGAAASRSTAGTRAVNGLRAVEPQVCPFCGAINDNPPAACRQCTLEDTPVTRQATRAKLGPWFVLQTRNPAAPGMNFATLMALVDKGRITPRSIVRGPTTQQMWRFANQVKGISRLFGVCWHCGGGVAKSAHMCPGCKRMQDAPLNPDVLLEGSEAGGPRVAPVMAATPTPIKPAHDPKLAEQFGTPVIAAQPDHGEAEFAVSLQELTGASSPQPAIRPTADAPAAPPPPMATVPPAVRVVEDPEPRVVGMDAFGSGSRLGNGPKKKSRIGLKIFLALLLAVGVFAGAVACDTALREQYWYQARSLWAQWTGDTRFTLNNKPPAMDYRPKFAMPDDMPLNEPHPYPVAPPATLPEARPSAAVQGPAVQGPAVQGPAVQGPAVQGAVMENSSPALPWPEGAGIPLSLSHLPATQPAATVPEDQSLRQNAWRLWSEGVNAQTEQRYRDALRYYEALKALPEKYWPLGLDQRLQQMRVLQFHEGPTTQPQG